MNLTDWISSKWNAATLPSIPLPKAPKGATAEPSYRTVVGGTAAALQRTDRQLLNSDRLGVRTTSTTRDAIRQLSYSSPDVSASIYANLRSGIPEGHTLVARNMDGGIDVPATQLAQELLRRITYLGNVDGSFGAQISLQSLSESLGRELLMYGALAGEIALDKARVPASLNPISVTKLRLYDEDKTWKPVQIVGGEEIDLDIPTFIYVSLDQDLLDPYSSSPLESAQQPVIFDLDFNNDIRKALKRAVLPRLVANIDSELIKKNTPPDVLNDPNKFAQYKQDIISAVQGVVNGAAPEDAFISFSEVEYAFVEGGNDPSAIIEKMQAVINSKLQTGVKTMPVVLGHGGSANTSSAESLLFLKNANIVRVKLNEFYSRALTIAVRLMGQDCYVEFKYDQLDLRPDGELEAYKSMKQSRILDQLSLGLISDEEACVILTGNLPPAGYKPLTGTMFRSTAPVASNSQPGTAASGTSAMGKAPEQPKGTTKAEIDDLLNSHTEAMERTQTQAIAAIQDMAYTVTRTQSKPVEVNVAPSQVHLTLAEAKKVPKTYVVTRDEEGMFSGIKEEVTE
jgi:hypothetical protein